MAVRWTRPSSSLRRRGGGSLNDRRALVDGALMSDTRSLIAPLLVVGLVAIGLALFLHAPAGGLIAPRGDDGGARYRPPGGDAGSAIQPLPSPAPPRFAPAIAPSDQQIVLRALAEARPEARRVIDLVAGLVTFSVGKPSAGVAGLTTSTRDGYDVLLDLGGVYRSSGIRGIRRLVLHELGHVADHALVQRDLEAQLDRATPPGFGCDDGNSGACAAREERFAESFAKWATGDIGNDLNLGYRVPPPASLAGWGAPLAALTR